MKKYYYLYDKNNQPLSTINFQWTNVCICFSLVEEFRWAIKINLVDLLFCFYLGPLKEKEHEKMLDVSHILISFFMILFLSTHKSHQMEDKNLWNCLICWEFFFSGSTYAFLKFYFVFWLVWVSFIFARVCIKNSLAPPTWPNFFSFNLNVEILFQNYIICKHIRCFPFNFKIIIKF